MAQLTSLFPPSTGFFTLGNNTSSLSPGYMWFNCSNNKLQYSYCGNAWSLGGSLITSIVKLAGAGIQNAALAIGGCASFNASTCT